MKFRYLKDPTFIAAWCFYAANRWLLKPSLPAGETFFRGHFNDLLLIPCVLPLILLLHRRFSLRHTDAPPRAGEIALHLLVWSIYFELIGPVFVRGAIGDAWDVLAYCVGGIICWAIWNRPTVASLKRAARSLSTDVIHQPLNGTKPDENPFQISSDLRRPARLRLERHRAEKALCRRSPLAL